MAEEEENQPFMPDWVSPPGESILDYMDFYGILSAEACETLGLSLARFENLLIGDEPITDEIAEKLSDLFARDGRRQSAQFWKNRERIYREDRKRLGI